MPTAQCPGHYRERPRSNLPMLFVSYNWNCEDGKGQFEKLRALPGQTVKITRREGQDQAKVERKVDRNAHGEEGEVIQSHRKKVIRVESEETQDHVRESLDLGQEEAEYISFMPSAISIPQRPMFLV